MSPLARLDALRLRRFWRLARRDPALLGALAILATIGALSAGQAIGMAVGLGPLRFLVYGVFGAATFASCWPMDGSRYRRELDLGPLQPWTLDRAGFSRWLLVRTAVQFTAIVGLLAGLALIVRPAEAVPLTATLLLGGAVAAGVLWTGRRSSRARTPTVRQALRESPARPRIAAPAWWILVVAALWARGVVTFRGVEALAVLVLTSAGAGLAARNNDSPEIGVGVALVGALLASGSIPRSDSGLIRLLGVQPIGLPRLWWVLNGPLSVIAALGAAACVWTAGLGWAAGLGVGLVILILQLCLGALQVLHGVGRSPRLATVSLGSDMVGGTVFLGLFGSWTVPLLLLRLYGLVRGARRRRWNG